MTEAMKIVRESRLTGSVNSMWLTVTPEQLEAWDSGKVAQEAFPQLNASEREFVMTGITDEEWDAAFGNSEEDEELDEDEAIHSYHVRYTHGSGYGGGE